MINVAYACPKCEQTVQCNFELALPLKCPTCGHSPTIQPDFIREGEIHRCLSCGGRELYVRKDFSQRLGVGIVIVGMLLSSLTWYYYMIYLTFAILFAAAALDALLYFLVGNVLQCYRCQAQYRGIAGLETREPFNLETHERYRQQAARINELSQSQQQANSQQQPKQQQPVT